MRRFEIALIAAAIGAAAVSTAMGGESAVASLEQQMQDDAWAAVRANANAKSYAEWAESGFTPREVFKNAAALGAWAELCTALTKLAGEDLALFEDEIRLAGEQLPCLHASKRTIIKHWMDSTSRLKVSRALEAQVGVTILEHTRFEVRDLPVDAKTGPVFYNGGLKPGQIALTFDDGPDPERTERLLEILETYGAKATFFETGEHARAYPEISLKVRDAGHTVGSHSVDHKLLTKLAVKSAEHEITDGREQVAVAAGLDSAFFRFPFGGKNKALQQFAREQGLATFFWNMDTNDWKYRDPAIVYRNFLAEIKRERGGIILFHDVQEQTIRAMPHVLEQLLAQDYELVVFRPI